MTTSHPKPVTNHAWTTHGHPCCRQPGPTVGTQPDTVARCGGPGICTDCATQATEIHGQTQPEPAADDTKTEPAPDQNRPGIRLELIAEGPVFITGCLHGPSGQHHPINLPPDDWNALDSALDRQYAKGVVIEAARACRALCGEKTGPAFNSLAYAESLVRLGAAVDALDGTP